MSTTKKWTMTAKHPGRCSCGCGGTIAVGQQIDYSRVTGARLAGHTTTPEIEALMERHFGPRHAAPVDGCTDPDDEHADCAVPCGLVGCDPAARAGKEGR